MRPCIASPHAIDGPPVSSPVSLPLLDSLGASSPSLDDPSELLDALVVVGEVSLGSTFVIAPLPAVPDEEDALSSVSSPSPDPGDAPHAQTRITNGSRRMPTPMHLR